MRHVPPEAKEQAAEAQATLFVRMAVVMRITGLGRSTICRLMAEDKFPSPVAGQTCHRLGAHRPRPMERGAAHSHTLMARAARPSSCRHRRALGSRYDGNINFSTMPINSKAATTLPHRQVVNR